MNDNQRHKASIDQTLHYLSTYYQSWRLAKILSLEKTLNSRYEFFNDIIDYVKQNDDSSGDATIAQEIKNGIYFDTISTCVLYIEDLFAMLKASEQPDYFIRNIITYRAGEISKYIQEYKVSKERVSKNFHFILNLNIGDDSKQKEYNDAINELLEMVSDCIKFYNQFKFANNKYKHGLSVALRPFGKKITDKNLELDKQNNYRPYLHVYDSSNLNTASKTGSFSGKMILIPFMTKNTMPFNVELHNENNLLRSVSFEENSKVDFEKFIDIGFKVSICLNCFITNYTRSISKEEKTTIFQLPIGFMNRKTQYLTITINHSD